MALDARRTARGALAGAVAAAVWAVQQPLDKRAGFHSGGVWTRLAVAVERAG